MRFLTGCFALSFLFACLGPQTLTAETPKVLDPRLKLELVAEHPQIVTPIGIAFAPDGSLLVIESHTHHRQDDYDGPPTDRIRRFADTDGDGRFDTWSTFYEGTESTMSLRTGPDGWVYVATRMEIFRLRDTNGDHVADQRQEIAHLETEGRYPHNGLAGLAFGPDGRLYFGLGENLGEPYAIVGSDGTRLSGGGEGGTIYHTQMDGSQLQRLATGVWNPFGMGFDPEGRLFMVDNDPDSRPPCRLLQIVPGGDYGYQFRYGRTGVHPLQAWNGELPGTLPMVAGTGEAPSAVVWYAGVLWGTSWGDHRVETFRLKPNGASVQATAQTVVQGDHNFRPVDFAIAPDGSLYFTDWVDRSYPVHGKGRIWRLSWKEGQPESKPLALSDAEKEAAKLRESSPDLETLNSDDPFLRQAAVYGLSQQTDRLRSIDLYDNTTGRQRAGILEAMRWADETQFLIDRPQLLQEALEDHDDEVRIFAMRWIADLKLKQYLPLLKARLKEHSPTTRELPVLLSAIAWLESGSVGGGKDIVQQKMLAEIIADDKQTPQLRTIALRLIDPTSEQLKPELLRTLVDSPNHPLAEQALRTLYLAGGEFAMQVAAEVALDESRDPNLRAWGIVGLSDHADQHQDTLKKLAKDSNEIVRQEAKRTLRTDMVADPIPPTDLEAWSKGIEGTPDIEAGRRTFVSSKGGYCVRCHRFDGSGADVGPDLTYIGQRITKEKLLESILQPSQEIAPMYVPKVVLTDDGQMHIGYPVTVAGINEKRLFVDTAGKRFELDPSAIEEERESEKSIMPEGFQQIISPEEMRDLIGFLMNTPE
ncbi:PVC-type heme-binding CxxCH protein [Blastopirellula marina]|uniref:Cytochrome C n=1 Tax=Blastopirellula marina TaxID=124 RepID=A0A2S8GNX7_9BACT|nr:PVC-type heme-binding CxxCH protein [Blastopirellula marina]PQO46130.1 cytochrome C [Blastopirellula marina]